MAPTRTIRTSSIEHHDEWSAHDWNTAMMEEAVGALYKAIDQDVVVRLRLTTMLKL
jgi:hypothetical protein